MWHTFVKVRLLMMFAPPLALVMWLGLSSSAQHFDRSPMEVKSALAEAALPLHILGGTVVGSSVTEPDDQTVVTALLDRDGNELMRFVTKVLPDGAGSEVQTSVVAPAGEHQARAKAAMETEGVAMSLMEKLAQEHVAAAIEDRPFDMLAFSPAARAMLDSMPGMSEQVDAANRAAAEMAEDMDEDVDADDADEDPTEAWDEA